MPVCNPSVSMGKLEVETQQSAAQGPASLVHTAANNEDIVSNKPAGKDQHPSVSSNLYTSIPLPLLCAPIYTCIHMLHPSTHAYTYA